MESSKTGGSILDTWIKMTGLYLAIIESDVAMVSNLSVQEIYWLCMKLAWLSKKFLNHNSKYSVYGIAKLGVSITDGPDLARR